MFVGHYSAAFALKASQPRLPLWAMFLAVQAVDLGWALLVMAGVEKARVVPGFTAAFPVDLYYMPYTHSLLATAAWAAALGLAWYGWRRGDGRAAALAVAAAVASHWFLDLLVHAPDLPLYGNQHKLGLGLWNYPLPELLLELVLLLGSAALYARALPQHARRAWSLAAVLSVVQAMHTLGPWLLNDERAVAAMALGGYLAFAAAAAWVERGSAG
jgi:hypothetical protein